MNESRLISESDFDDTQANFKRGLPQAFRVIRRKKKELWWRDRVYSAGTLRVPYMTYLPVKWH